MKRSIVLGFLAMLAISSCQVKEEGELAPEGKTFTATMEAMADDATGVDTKTSMDSYGNVLWKKGDQVSIFVASTINQHFQVTDASDGKTAAALNQVESFGFVAGGDIPNNVAYYPYVATAAIAKRSGGAYLISDISLPATQNYAESSFGNGAFPMTAVTSSTNDYNLKFKNVLGGLKLQLKGNATITSISITGNNNDVLCGAAEVTVSAADTPAIALTDATATTVTLDCGDGVQLDEETATAFIIALPPMTMTGGFTVTVTDTEGKQMEIKTTKTQTFNRSKLLKMPVVIYEGSDSYLSNPFTITSIGSTSVSIIKEGSPDDIALEYRKGVGIWTTYTIGDPIVLVDSEFLQFRAGEGENNRFSRSEDDYYSISVTGSGAIEASGNIMSLLDRSLHRNSVSEHEFENLFINCASLVDASKLKLPVSTLAWYCYRGFFKGCSSLTTSPELPATTLANGCYEAMFFGCTSLATAPELPATTLANGCYLEMFSDCISITSSPALPATELALSCYMAMFTGCSSLFSTPELPATTLAESCYSRMFSGCVNITTAPVLPATSLARHCYLYMFSGCTSLTEAPNLPATELAYGCYSCMFSYCSNLVSTPELPATTLAEGCYSSMFAGCTSLTTAPALPATTLAKYCYSCMFAFCANLTSAPELPATTLAEGCYSGMFEYCTSLTVAPELPATTLVEGCYSSMFINSTKLNYIKALFTTMPDETYTLQWVAGVAPTGTFVKNPDATWEVTGIHGVPSEWMVFYTPKAVELGLPSGIKWASFNVGASAPEEYGDYFAWGETAPYYTAGHSQDSPCSDWRDNKTGYNWASYKFELGTDYIGPFSKYVTNSSYGTVDNNTVLDPEDDAASVNWGGTWRMPTDAEWTELRTECTWTWTTQNGVNGWLVTGPNGNSIFLPAAGRRYDTLLYGAGSGGGYYWSSSLDTDDPSSAYRVYFGYGDYDWSYRSRFCGLSVRAVTE